MRTWSPASTRSSTSERQRPQGAALLGWVRLVHPFPSALDAVAAATVAAIAGASGGVAIRLGLGMLGLQFAIGAANDFADAASDTVAKPEKPIPAGQVARGAAGVVASICAGWGLLAAATVGGGALVVAAVGLVDGLIYDLRLKGTALAWMPFAAGVGLLPLYGWFGASTTVPVALPGVVALAVVAGAILALANAWSDVENDRRSGLVSIATYLGPRRTLKADAALLGSVQLIALATTVAIAGATPLLLVEGAGSGIGWLGLSLAAVQRDWCRPLVWEIQAVAILVLGAGWLAVLQSAGMLTNH